VLAITLPLEIHVLKGLATQFHDINFNISDLLWEMAHGHVPACWS
jgi:hypothetical protein